MNRRFQTLSLMVVFSILTSFSARAEDQKKTDPYKPLAFLSGVADVFSLYAWGSSAKDRMETEAGKTAIENTNLYARKSESHLTPEQVNGYVDTLIEKTEPLKKELGVKAESVFAVNYNVGNQNSSAWLSASELKKFAANPEIKVKMIKFFNKDLMTRLEKSVDRKYFRGQMLKFPVVLSTIATAGFAYKSHLEQQEISPSAVSDRSAPTRQSVLAESQADIPVAPQTGGGGLR